jgi:hypothetical protein
MVFCAVSGEANNASASEIAALVLPPRNFRPKGDMYGYLAW